MEFKNKIGHIQSKDKTVEELKAKVIDHYKGVELLSFGYKSNGNSYVEFYLPVDTDKPLIC